MLVPKYEKHYWIVCYVIYYLYYLFERRARYRWMMFEYILIRTISNNTFLSKRDAKLGALWVYWACFDNTITDWYETRFRSAPVYQQTLRAIDSKCLLFVCVCSGLHCLRVYCRACIRSFEDRYHSDSRRNRFHVHWFHYIMFFLINFIMLLNIYMFIA